jgi:hypothetical protein
METAAAATQATHTTKTFTDRMRKSNGDKARDNTAAAEARALLTAALTEYKDPALAK